MRWGDDHRPIARYVPRVSHRGRHSRRLQCYSDRAWFFPACRRRWRRSCLPARSSAPPRLGKRSFLRSED